MSLEAWGDEGSDADPVFDEARVEEAFRDGLRTAREYMARFVEQGGDAQTAISIRANWHPLWGVDEGPMSGPIWISAWGADEELHARCRANLERIMAEHDRDSDASLAEDAKRLSGEAVAARAEGIATPPSSDPAP